MISGIGDYLRMKQLSLAVNVSTNALRKANNVAKQQAQDLLKALPQPNNVNAGGKINKLI